MRKPILVLLAGLSVVVLVLGVMLLRPGSPTEPVADPTPDLTAPVARITVQELNEQLRGAQPPVIWEFVGELQFSNGHLPGSQLMTFDQLPEAVKGLDRSRPIVTVCT